MRDAIVMSERATRLYFEWAERMFETTYGIDPEWFDEVARTG